MTRNTHDLVNDHFGTAEAEQIASGTATAGYVPVSTGAGTAAAWTNVGSGTNVLSWKASVLVATTTSGTLASSFENGDSVDGVTLATGDRILVKNQSTGSENGVYTVNASGAPSRALDMDAGSEARGSVIFVEQGTANDNTIWYLATNAPITIGSTSLVFTQFVGGTSVDLVNDDTAYVNDGIRFTNLATYLGAEEGTSAGYDALLLIDTAGDFMELYAQSSVSVYCAIDFDPATPQMDLYASGAVDAWVTMGGDTGLVDMSATTNAFVPPTRASDPSSPLEGWTYYNTTTHKLRVYDGSTWQDCW